MGNSLRSTLGNMCGGQASKEIDADHEQRPVEKPKKVKKEKKSKKKNKTKNGHLGEIPEENEPEKPIEETEKKKDSDSETNAGEEVKQKEESDGIKTPSENMATQSNPDETLLEKSASIKDRSASPTSVDQTYFIQTIPEFHKPVVNHGNTSPLTKEVLAPLPKTQITQVTVEEEEHNTLDFGKYIFIDPSTGDIQVMRNRSRSLDSLVSMQSNRSSISRFGSFEFVTDFEINIAEKNQQNMVKL